jgi:hypothetical protein
MKQAFRVALTLALATVAFFASSAAHAQDTTLPADPAGAQNPNQIRALFFPGSSSSSALYRYYDDDGWGYLSVGNYGSAWYTGNPLVTVQLSQNGRQFSGSGISYGGLLFFEIQGYFFQCYAPGWGTYHPGGYPYSQRRFYLSGM